MRIKKLFIYVLIGISAIPFWMVVFGNDAISTPLGKIANILGLLGGLMMIWSFLLGVRPLLRIISPDIVYYLRIHKNLGIYGGLLALIHPVFEMIVYASNLTFLYMPDFSSSIGTFMTYGRIAFWLLVAIWITSALIRSRIKFRPWLYIHYLTYPLTLMFFVHGLSLGTSILTFWWIRYYWLLLGAMFIGTSVIRLMTFLNMNNSEYILEKSERLDNDIWLYTFRPKEDKLMPAIGQFCYLKLSLYGEVHPFTVMEYDKQTGRLVFGIKSVGSFSKKMEKLRIGDSVLIEGPYGKFTKEGHNSDPKLIISGGIGVTPFVELVKKYGDSNTYMINCNRNLRDAVRREEMLQKLGDRYIDVLSIEKLDRRGILSGYITKEIIEKLIDRNLLKKAKVFICGRPEFMDIVKKYLGELGVRSGRIYTEEFGY